MGAQIQPSEEAGTGLRDSIISGIVWKSVNQMLLLAVQLGVMVVLARLLTPRDYGLVGMVTAITGFAAIFVDLGLTTAIIQKQDTTQVEMSTAFWTNNGMGILVFVVVWFLASPIARFYEEPSLIWITRCIGCVFILTPLSSVHNALLMKSLRFRSVVLINSTALLVSSVAAITSAFIGLGYWSLLIQPIVMGFVNAVLLWLIVGWVPSLAFSGRVLKGFMGFSGYLSLNQAVGYWSRNIDKLMIGRLAGTISLGLYSRAYILMLMPLQQVSNVVDSVLFPAYAKIQNNRREIAQIYLKAMRLTALVTFPISFGLWAISEPAVLVVFGSKWYDAVPILQVLCPLGAVQSILSLNGSIYLSQGNTRRALVVTSCVTLGTSIAFYLGYWAAGMTGMVWAYFIFCLMAAPFIYLSAASLIQLTLLDLLRNLRGLAEATVSMLLVVLCLRFLVDSSGCLMQLSVLVTGGFVAYLIALHLLRVKAYREAVRLVRLKLLGALREPQTREGGTLGSV